MRVYHYDRRTGAFTGSGEAEPSPLEQGVFLVPGFATTVEPPIPDPGKFAAWDVVKAAWAIKALPEPPIEIPSPTVDDLRAILRAQLDAAQATVDALRALL